jgi:hypothetical protein
VPTSANRCTPAPSRAAGTQANTEHKEPRHPQDKSQRLTAPDFVFVSMCAGLGCTVFACVLFSDAGRALRGRLLAQSYAARGVTEAQYQVYWESYIEPRWQEHGARRATDASVMGGLGGEGSHLALSCHAPLPQLVEQLLATGWFQRDAGTPRPSSRSVLDNDALSGEAAAAKASAVAGRDTGGGVSGNDDGIISQSNQRSQSQSSSRSFQSTTGNAGAPGRLRPRPLPQSLPRSLPGASEAASGEAASGKPRYKDDVGLPAATSIAFAVLATGLLSTLGPGLRSALFVVLGSLWWYFRGRH